MTTPKTLFSKLFRKQNGNCYICGCGMSRNPDKDNFATFDHIIPKSHMRKTGIDFIRNNKKLACKTCNEKRGSGALL